MKKTLTSILIAVLVLLSRSIKSQVLPPSDLQIALKPIVPLVVPNAVLDTLTDPFSLIQQDSSLKVLVNIVLQDTVALNIIHLKLGTTLGGSELMTEAFNYAGSNVGAGLNFIRSLNNVKIDLGEHPNTNNALYYVAVELEDDAGNKSTITTTDSSQ